MSQKIKAFITDVDGVWTDGKLWLNESGEMRRAFHAHDGFGLKELVNAGIPVAIITGSKTQDIQKRAEWLGIKEVHIGIENKLDIFQRVLKKWNIGPEEILYVGDDVPDMEILKIVGYPFTVPNAHKSILALKNITCTEKQGGEGAVREICDRILER